METQGWLLRRMLSHINRICGRPHRPRDDPIRKLCGIAGVTWPDPPEGDNEEEDDEQESEESEYESEEDESQSESEVKKGPEPGGTSI